MTFSAAGESPPYLYFSLVKLGRYILFLRNNSRQTSNASLPSVCVYRRGSHAAEDEK